MKAIYALGTRTPWGRIVAVAMVEGERYYWMEDKHGTISMMPSVTVHTSRG